MNLKTTLYTIIATINISKFDKRKMVEEIIELIIFQTMKKQYSFKQMKKHYQLFRVQMLMDKTKLKHDCYLLVMIKY